MRPSRCTALHCTAHWPRSSTDLVDGTAPQVAVVHGCNPLLQPPGRSGALTQASLCWLRMASPPHKHAADVDTVRPRSTTRISEHRVSAGRMPATCTYSRVYMFESHHIESTRKRGSETTSLWQSTVHGARPPPSNATNVLRTFAGAPSTQRPLSALFIVIAPLPRAPWHGRHRSTSSARSKHCAWRTHQHRPRLHITVSYIMLQQRQQASAAAPMAAPTAACSRVRLGRRHRRGCVRGGTHARFRRPQRGCAWLGHAHGCEAQRRGGRRGALDCRCMKGQPLHAPPPHTHTNAPARRT